MRITGVHQIFNKNGIYLVLGKSDNFISHYCRFGVNNNTYMFFFTNYCTAVRGGLDED
jgi:hypothetical protein